MILFANVEIEDKWNK